jgi:nucleotide-binding universal stress UspA family protein
MKVLVGFDDSAGAWDALALTKTLAASAECEALLVDVLPGPEPIPIPYRILPAERLPEETGAPLELARTSLRGIEVEARTVVGGSPARVLHDLAEMESAELIVVGSPHRGPLGRTFLGSVAEGLLHGSPAPVAVAPRGYRGQSHGAPRVIAVAYDGSAEAKLALVHAEALAAAAGAAIRVLTVAEPAAVVPGVAGYTPPLGLDPGDLIPAALASVDPMLEVDGRELSGAPAAALATACEDGVDLRVTGSRGYGPLGRVFAGSVAAGVICRSPCPVIVVPRAKRGGRDGREVALGATHAGDGES